MHCPSILDTYAFNDREEEEQELKSLEKELMLDADFIQGFQKEKEEKEKLRKELNSAKENYEVYKNKIKDLESQLSNF